MTIDLHSAIFSSWANGTDLTDVEALLDAGHDVNGRNEDGNTPLTMAAMLGAMPERSEAATRLLLARGADPNLAVDDQAARTPLHIAVTTIGKGTVHALLEGGADPDMTCAAGATALHHTVHELRKAWTHNDIANPNGNAATAADFVTSHIKALAKHGADFTLPDPAGVTLVQLVCTQKGCPDTLIEALLDAGATVKGDHMNINGAPIDMLAASLVLELSPNICARFLAAGCPYDVPYAYFGDRPYVEVVAQFAPETALVLARSNSDFRDALVAVRTPGRNTMLGVVALSGHAELVQYLAEHGLRPDVSYNGGRTALDLVEEQAPEHAHLLRALM